MRLFKVIKARNREIEDAFGSDMGVKLMRVESDITLNAVKLSTGAGIPVAPIHDAMLCPAKDEGNVIDFMQRAYTMRLPRVSPCPVSVSRQNIPHMVECSSPSPLLSPPVPSVSVGCSSRGLVC